MHKTDSIVRVQVSSGYVTTSKLIATGLNAKNWGYLLLGLVSHGGLDLHSTNPTSCVHLEKRLQMLRVTSSNCYLVNFKDLNL